MRVCTDTAAALRSKKQESSPDEASAAWDGAGRVAELRWPGSLGLSAAAGLGPWAALQPLPPRPLSASVGLRVKVTGLQDAQMKHDRGRAEGVSLRAQH